MNKGKLTNTRLLSLDVFRGITIAGMILVNNPGNWNKIYAPLGHSEWNGLTPTDLVFPFFVLIMGISIYLSFKKFNFKISTKTFTKLLRRSVLIFLIGLFLNWFGLFYSEFNALSSEGYSFLEKIRIASLNFEKLRILGVLQRLAIISFFGSIIILLVKHKYIPWLVAGTLILYWIIIGSTWSYMPSDDNIIVVIDKLILGANHLYIDHFSDGSKLVFEPEGIISTIPSIAQVLIGFLIGKIISENKNTDNAIRIIFVLGTCILFVGFLMSYGFPINKKLWSSSYVLVTSGLGALLLALLIWIIDIKNKRQWWCNFFESFGVNPIFIYIISFLLSILLININVKYNGQWNSLKTLVNNNYIIPFFNDYFASLIYALVFVIINWFISHILYKKRIYIKL